MLHYVILANFKIIKNNNYTNSQIFRWIKEDFKYNMMREFFVIIYYTFIIYYVYVVSAFLYIFLFVIRPHEYCLDFIIL